MCLTYELERSKQTPHYVCYKRMLLSEDALTSIFVLSVNQKFSYYYLDLSVIVKYQWTEIATTVNQTWRCYLLLT